MVKHNYNLKDLTVYPANPVRRERLTEGSFSLSEAKKNK